VHFASFKPIKDELTKTVNKELGKTVLIYQKQLID